MPHFRVMLEGDGIDIPSDDDGPSIAGFFTTRLVHAETEEEAEEIAKRLILTEWSSEPYASRNKGSLPSLTISSVHKSGFVERFISKYGGYTFYPQENQSA